METNFLWAGWGRYKARSSSLAKVTRKQCVKPLSNISGLLLVPHSNSMICGIFLGSAAKAFSTFLMSSALADSLNLKITTWRSFLADELASFSSACDMEVIENTPTIIRKAHRDRQRNGRPGNFIGGGTFSDLVSGGRCSWQANI